MIHSRAGKTASTAIALICVATLASTNVALAHPHVWVTTETTVLYENGTIVGLRQKWSFDEFYTSMALQGLDTNNDGVYDRGELAELAKVNMEGLKEFDYFTTVKLATDKLKLGAPKDVWLEHTDAPEGQTQITVTTGDAAFEGTGAEVKDKDKAADAPAKPGVFARLWAWLFGESGKTDKPGTKEAAKPKVLSLNFTLPLAQPVLAEAQGFTFSIADSSFFIAFEPAAQNPVVLGPGAPAGCRVAIGEIPVPPPGTAAPDAGAGEESKAPAEAASAENPPPAETNPAADASKLGEAFTQQFGEQTVAFGFVKPATVSCGPPS